MLQLGQLDPDALDERFDPPIKTETDFGHGLMIGRIKGDYVVELFDGEFYRYCLVNKYARAEVGKTQ